MTSQLKMTALDCSDPRAEAAFWSGLLGWDVVAVEDAYAMLVPPGGGPALGFGQVEGYAPPGWPHANGAKQFHLDLGCDDLAAEEERALALGATLADPQPGDTWRVLLDPAGHPVSLYTPSRQYPLTAGSTVNDLEFGARYIQTQAAVTAGPANSVSTFTIIYN